MPMPMPTQKHQHQPCGMIPPQQPFKYQTPPLQQTQTISNKNLSYPNLVTIPALPTRQKRCESFVSVSSPQSSSYNKTSPVPHVSKYRITKSRDKINFKYYLSRFLG